MALDARLKQPLSYEMHVISQQQTLYRNYFDARIPSSYQLYETEKSYLYLLSSQHAMTDLSWLPQSYNDYTLNTGKRYTSSGVSNAASKTRWVLDCSGSCSPKPTPAHLHASLRPRLRLRICNWKIEEDWEFGRIRFLYATKHFWDGTDGTSSWEPRNRFRYDEFSDSGVLPMPSIK